LPSATGKNISEQSWFKWCEVLVTIWGVLTPIYAGLEYFWKFAPIWTAHAGAPRWFDLILTYSCFPVAVLGVYVICMVLVGLVAFLFTSQTQFRWYQVAIGVPMGTIYLVRSLSSPTVGDALTWPFFFGLFFLFLCTTGTISKALRHR